MNMEKTLFPKVQDIINQRLLTQEAHEAIRPTNFTYSPKLISKYLDKDQLKLYDLIWKRTLSSQMASAELDKTTVDIKSKDNSLLSEQMVLRLLFLDF